MKRWLDACLIVLAVAVAAGQNAPDATEVIGILEKVAPPASLRSKAGKEISLHSSDEGHLLYLGDALRVTGKGEVVVDLADGTEVDLRHSNEWRTLSAGKGEKTVADVREALNEISTLGGTERGISSPISPAEGTAVRADHFVVAWAPKSSPVLLTLQQGYDVIWKHTESGATGRMASDSVRAALHDIRDKKGGEIVVQLQDADGDEWRSSFYVLSSDEEKQLEKQLAASSEVRDPLVRTLIRAYQLSSYKLYQEAADEYQAAWRLMPESESLRKAAFAADARAGFSPRPAQ